jgi:Ni/Co efflux regulator RcnB
VRFEFESGTVSFCFSFIFVSLGESCLLVSWCAGGWCGMACSNEDHGRSRRSGVEDRGWSHRSGTRWSGDRDIGWRHVRSTPDMWRRGARVSWLSLKTKIDDL